MMRFLRAAGGYLLEHHLELVELALSIFITWLIIVEVRFAKEAEKPQAEQLRLINELLSTAQRQAAALDKTIDAQSLQAETLQGISKRLQDQVALLAAEEDRRLAELARKPRLQLTAGGLDPTRTGLEVPSTHATPNELETDLVLRNVGTAPARSITLRVVVDRKDVSVSCGPCIEAQLPSGSAGRTWLIDVQLLRAGNRLTVPLHLALPGEERPPFIVSFNADAENVPLTNLGSIRITTSSATGQIGAHQ